MSSLHSHQAEAPDAELDNPNLYINREISWLAFNDRVLDQAADATWPLLERLKFLSIHATNLDEFFMIRVSGLHEQLEAGVSEPLPDGLSTIEQLARIRELVHAQLARAAHVLTETLLPELERHGIFIRPVDSFDEARMTWATSYFRSAVFPVLTPLAVDLAHPFPFVSNLSLSLAVEAEDPATGERRFARVKVPETLPRFVHIPSTPGDPTSDPKLEFVPLEDLILHNLGDLFPGMTVVGAHPFRVTRDMDLEILEAEAEDLMSIIDREVRKRRFGAAVRLEVAASIPASVRALLEEKLEIDAEDVYEFDGLLGRAGLGALAQLAHPDLRDGSFVPRTPPLWRDRADCFSAIRAGDVLLHHPYDGFGPVLELLNQAADDPSVLAIKITLYRAGTHSDAVRALIRAAENGKQVAVSIELKARFDEENNIGSARALERAGAHVFYGTPHLKTHAKALLIVRREGAELRRYVHLSTGNYNAVTARVYTDLGLMTATDDYGEDASELFNMLSGFSHKTDYRRMVVAPVSLRERVLGKIHEQTERARSGQPARILAKMNSLVDKPVIRALYEASRAGVEIDLVVRGICCLRPGVPGVSERIRVRSLVGRFLEHERIFVFGPEGEDEMYLASADWMPRNFDRRVELMFPVSDPALVRQVHEECIAPIALDNSRVYEMGSDGVYRRRQPATGEEPVDAQMVVVRLATQVRVR